MPETPLHIVLPDQTPIPATPANAFSLLGGSSDFLLSIGRTAAIQTPDGGLHAAVHWYQSIVISPLAAKQLSHMLVEAVDAYEKEMGTIKVPSSSDSP